MVLFFVVPSVGALLSSGHPMTSAEMLVAMMILKIRCLVDFNGFAFFWGCAGAC